jgi:hypothetical protein
MQLAVLFALLYAGDMMFGFASEGEPHFKEDMRRKDTIIFCSFVMMQVRQRAVGRRAPLAVAAVRQGSPGRGGPLGILTGLV